MIKRLFYMMVDILKQKFSRFLKKQTSEFSRVDSQVTYSEISNIPFPLINLPRHYMENDITMKCQYCEERYEELYMKNKFNGNEDDNEYCVDCYFLVHGEHFSGEPEFEIKQEKNEFYRGKFKCQ